MLSNIVVGTKVRIVTDCRAGAPATGKMATYDGDLPRSIIRVDSGDYTEYSLEEWEGSPLKATTPTRDEVYKNLPADPEPQPLDFPDEADADEADADETADKASLIHAASAFVAWAEAHNDWLRRNKITFWYARTNPQMTLEDGSVIWGEECRWHPVEE